MPRITKVGDKRRELKHTPKCFARIFALQFFENRFRIFAKETEEGVLEGVFHFAVVTMFINGNPIDQFHPFHPGGRRSLCDAAYECIRKKFG